MLLKCYQPKTRTAYFFWLAQCFNLQHIITVSLAMMWVTGDEGASATFLCWHNRRHQSDFFFLSFFLIKYLCWVRISSFPVKPTHWKWTLSYFLSHSLDERENRTNEVAEKNKLDRLDLSEPSHCLPKKRRQIKSAVDSWVDQQSRCPGWGLLSLDKCCFWPWLSWKDIICIIEMEKLGARPLLTWMRGNFLM